MPATPSATANGEWGAPVGGLTPDFTQASCAAVGGRFDSATSCSYNYISYYRLVENQDTYRVFTQLNGDINDHMKFHAEASFGEVSIPQVMGSPAQPMINGPALATGSTYQFYVPITNPYAAEFAASHGIVGASSGFTPFVYRLDGHGGNFFMANGDGYGVADKIDNQVWRASAGINGSLGDWASFLKDTNYDFAVTYNESNSYNTHSGCHRLSPAGSADGLRRPRLPRARPRSGSPRHPEPGARRQERMPLLEPLRDELREPAHPQSRQPELPRGRRERGRR